jgi:hypothetical protein
MPNLLPTSTVTTAMKTHPSSNTNMTITPVKKEHIPGERAEAEANTQGSAHRENTAGNSDTASDSNTASNSNTANTVATSDDVDTPSSGDRPRGWKSWGITSLTKLVAEAKGAASGQVINFIKQQ